MDIRDKSWHSRLKIAGIAKPIKADGSIMELMAQALTAIRDAKARTRADGIKRLTLELSDAPITDEDQQTDELVNTIDSMLDTSMTTSETPGDGEGYEEFRDRLVVQLHYPESVADVIAADWFDIPSTLSAWFHDSRAIAFRKMNASQAAYESADPSEYAALKQYCQDLYPGYMANMRLRS